jgi:hypothetical protein
MKYYKLDRDTKTYLKRMAVDGIKTPADIYSVNDFIVGLKDLNLQDFTEAYFYSNLQNAGSGTVYSFRNNLNNGTIAGTHNRRTDGIELIDTNDGGSGVINTNFLMPFAPCTFICIFRSPAQVGVTAPTVFYTAGVNNNGNQFVINSASLSDSRLGFSAKGKNWDTTISSNFTSGSAKNLRFNVGSFMMPDKRGPLRFGFNNTFNTGSSYVTADEGFNTTRQFYKIKGYNFSTVILHSALFFNRNLSDSEVTNIYNLIKVTSGKMLNIP